MDGEKFSKWDITHRAQMQWQDFVSGRDKEEQIQKVKKQEDRLNKPQHHTCELNYDIAVLVEGRVGLGFVIRDDQANKVLARKKEDEVSGSSTLLESYAMR